MGWRELLGQKVYLWDKNQAFHCGFTIVWVKASPPMEGDERLFFQFALQHKPDTAKLYYIAVRTPDATNLVTYPSTWPIPEEKYRPILDAWKPDDAPGEASFELKPENAKPDLTPLQGEELCVECQEVTCECPTSPQEPSLAPKEDSPTCCCFGCAQPAYLPYRACEEHLKNVFPDGIKAFVS